MLCGFLTGWCTDRDVYRPPGKCPTIAATVDSVNNTWACLREIEPSTGADSLYCKFWFGYSPKGPRARGPPTVPLRCLAACERQAGGEAPGDGDAGGILQQARGPSTGRRGTGAGSHAGDRWFGGGGALHFPGVNQYVSVPIDVPETEYTVEFWFRTDDPNAGLFCVVDANLGGGGHDRHVHLAGGNVRIRTWAAPVWRCPPG